MDKLPKWLEWIQQLQALAQTGLAFSTNSYDIERYTLIRKIAAEIAATKGTLEFQKYQNLFEGEKGYATPKVDVRAAVFRRHIEPQLLMVKEVEDGLWSLPGGWADVGDSPSEAAIREVAEEANLSIRTVKLLAVYDRNHPRHQHPPYLFHVYKLIFQCELVEQAVQVQEVVQSEISESGFFSQQEAVSLPLSSTRVTHLQIVRLFEHYKNPNLPTDFD